MPSVAPELRGPWLGQEAPSRKPAKLCSEILSIEQSGTLVAGIVLSPHGGEAFFTMNTSVSSR